MADPLNPFAPVPILRDLPTSFDAAAQASANTETAAPVAQLQRPPVAQGLGNIPQVGFAPAGVDGWKKLCNANPNRVSLLIRVRNQLPVTPGTVTVVYISPAGGGASGLANYFPIFEGDDFTLEVTGEVWAASGPSSNACIVHLAETLSVPQRL